MIYDSASAVLIKNQNHQSQTTYLDNTKSETMAVANPPGIEKMLPQVKRSVEEERLHRKQQLAGALRVFGKFGFSEGVAGHITARDPEKTDHFWVNPFGVSFNQMKVSDLILVNEEGEM